MMASLQSISMKYLYNLLDLTFNTRHLPCIIRIRYTGTEIKAKKLGQTYRQTHEKIKFGRPTIFNVRILEEKLKSGNFFTIKEIYNS